MRFWTESRDEPVIEAKERQEIYDEQIVDEIEREMQNNVRDESLMPAVLPTDDCLEVADTLTSMVQERSETNGNFFNFRCFCIIFHFI